MEGRPTCASGYIDEKATVFVLRVAFAFLAAASLFALVATLTYVQGLQHRGHVRRRALDHHQRRGRVALQRDRQGARGAGHLASSPSGSIDALRCVVTKQTQTYNPRWISAALEQAWNRCKICLQAQRLGRDDAAAGAQAVRADQQPGARPDPRLRRRERAVRHAHDPARRVLAPRARRAGPTTRACRASASRSASCVRGQRGPPGAAADRPGQRLLRRGQHDPRLRLLPRVAVLRARRVHGGRGSAKAPRPHRYPKYIALAKDLCFAALDVFSKAVFAWHTCSAAFGVRVLGSR